ncbi:family 16 glycosylhydrolase [Nocardioides terrisoli]|uniref:family 16 glycosylhydrolase n=1 Tax=Nocardioides terrisoli TaxID=3388267 RepID=UPI00287BA01B|nr:family 16 glycosylhydrolase [Nocardioides marmorisolisilvae]
MTRSIARASAAAIAALLAATLLPGSAIAEAPGPIHAGNTYGWYRSGVTRYEFHGHKKRFWHVSGRGTVRNQHGMLTLNTARRGSVSATLARAGHRTGRWEIRLRSRRYGSGHTNYRVVTQLIPAGTHKQHCGGRNIGLEDYRLGTSRTRFYIHTLPDNTFRARKGMRLHNDQWHTFAVEVTRHHISWFVDAHVVRTERRSAALSGVPLTVRFTMRATPHARMNRSRMQMDWLRYWTDRYPSTKSIRAPRTHRSTFNQAC